MRIPAFLLKPAACLLLGAAAVFGSTAAQAITMPWAVSYQISGGTQTGFGTLDATLVSGTTYQINSISGTFNGEAVTLVSSIRYQPNQSFFPDNLFDTQGVNNMAPVSANGWAFSTNNNRIIHNYLVNNNTTLINAQCSGGNCFNQASFGSPFTQISQNYATVPAPLPILGLPAVLFYSRRLTKRIQQRKALAVVA